MRVLLDYRPALRERTGVGEYVHQIARALARPAAGRSGSTSSSSSDIAVNSPPTDTIVVFSSSWKDRLCNSDVDDLGPVERIDLRWPVGLLNLVWHRAGWPPVELLTSQRFDVVHSPHPLLLPSRYAAQVITIHDLDFLTNPSRVKGEIQRDYGSLAKSHAHRADRVIVPSEYTAAQVGVHLGVPRDRISVCPEGVPEWSPQPQDGGSGPSGGFVLFLGTLEPRKNVGGLLTAYERLLARLPSAPKLILAGKAPPEAAPHLARLSRAPLAGRASHVGYVPPGQRQALYTGATLLVLPSFDEGFGLPVVEAMSLGVPVVASSRGALPEVLGDAGLLVNPDDPEGIASAMASVISDAGLAAALSARGKDRARLFSWTRAAVLTREAYDLAAAARQERARESAKRP